MNRSIKTTRSSALKKFVRNDKGATLMEYIMLAGLIAIVAFAGFKAFGSSVNSKISSQAGAVGGIPGTAN